MEFDVPVNVKQFFTEVLFHNSVKVFKNRKLHLLSCLVFLSCIQVSLQFAARINMRALHQAVEGTQRLLTQEPIMALNKVLHYGASLK